MPAPKDSLRKERWKENIRQHNIRTGKVPPSRLGIKSSEETKRKISEGLLKSGHCPPSALGIKRSDDFKEKVRKNHAHYWRGKKGILAPQYIDGRTPENKLARKTLEYKLWRKEIFERDNYTCQVCRNRGCELNADHIKSFSEYPELRLDVNNGRTLCVPCHRKTPNYGRKKLIVIRNN